MEGKVHIRLPSHHIDSDPARRAGFSYSSLASPEVRAADHLFNELTGDHVHKNFICLPGLQRRVWKINDEAYP